MYVSNQQAITYKHFIFCKFIRPMTSKDAHVAIIDMHLQDNSSEHSEFPTSVWQNKAANYRIKALTLSKKWKKQSHFLFLFNNYY